MAQSYKHNNLTNEPMTQKHEFMYVAQVSALEPKTISKLTQIPVEIIREWQTHRDFEQAEKQYLEQLEKKFYYLIMKESKHQARRLRLKEKIIEQQRAKQELMAKEIDSKRMKEIIEETRPKIRNYKKA
ncbi:hypothetical protein I6I27_10580 (plasmid) [Staphylococcus pasteuri]|uniref:hypothetical protein n=1 Tax=Bacillati TaxID=1783272 RepID=UPI001300A848|nr:MULTISPECIES: hypothetical protein [Terrabacteria group]MBF2186197.1 hypothetical protein [Staphylococcus warneri]MBL3399588.1 hypothetical protein [Staphylococcus pasteuri]MCI2772755.1 hypothetical protein [Staphylococcus warneri]MCI2785332.1 hypothetical protein [Staphylococcus warneri]